jgi:hypothetical protein
VCFVIEVEKAAQRTLGFVHSPGERRYGRQTKKGPD